MPAAAAVGHDLGRALQHLLHGLEVQALARDLRRRLVLRRDQRVALRLAVGLRHHRGLGALGLGADARGLAARLGHDLAGVGLGLVLDALLVLARDHDVVERLLHVLRRAQVLEVELGDGDPGAVAIHGLAQELARVDGEVGALAGQYRVHVGAADHLAHGAVGRLLERLLGLAHAEQELVGIGDRVLDVEVHVRRCSRPWSAS
jgi:hypothetical protein